MDRLQTGMRCARPRTGWLCSERLKQPRTSRVAIYWASVMCRAQRMLKKANPGHGLFTLLPAGKRWCTIKLQSSFFPQAPRFPQRRVSYYLVFVYPFIEFWYVSNIKRLDLWFNFLNANKWTLYMKEIQLKWKALKTCFKIYKNRSKSNMCLFSTKIFTYPVLLFLPRWKIQNLLKLIKSY